MANYYVGIRGAEVHHVGVGRPPSGNEVHCILPGTYDIVVDDIPYRMDYVQVALKDGNELTVTNQTDSTYRSAYVEASSLASLPWLSSTDLVFNIDLSHGPATDARILQVESANPTTETFRNQDPCPDNLKAGFGTGLRSPRVNALPIAGCPRGEDRASSGCSGTMGTTKPTGPDTTQQRMVFSRHSGS